MTAEHAVAKLATEVAPGYWPRAIGLRVVITGTYAALVPLGVLPMSLTWWAVSPLTLFIYAALMFAVLARWPDKLLLHRNVSPYADAFFVTLAITAVAKPEIPIWVGYLLIITSLSVFHSTKYLLAFSLWCIALLVCGGLIADAAGRTELDWRVTTVVSIFIAFTAMNCDTISTSNRKLRHLVHEASLTDPLTGLANRRRFREVLESHQLPEIRPLAVLMYDVDNFKQINETLGHVSADEILVKLAQALRESFRDADTIARYGGDELIILAHVNSVDEATAIAERSLAHVLDTVGVSLSAGVAVYPITSRTLEAAVQEADAALGRAKHSGKARAVAAESPAA